ncbi:MAG: divalent-cation tolerance protein CutA [Longimicrobiales bacterium]|nr:divalent-cation tolerance protein CutA [Longimicrobiales bacterium]
MSAPAQAVVTAVLTTVADPSAAQSLAHRLVEERLAACANILPGVTSVFWWEGAVQRESEVLVVFKTTEARYADLRRRLEELHSYDVPEVLRLSVPETSESYLAWVRKEVGES